VWTQLWERHRGAAVGAAAGVFFGVIYLIVGFWDMLVFAFLAILGYYIGSRWDRGELGSGIADLIRRMSEKWRLFR